MILGPERKEENGLLLLAVTAPGILLIVELKTCNGTLVLDVAIAFFLF